jgi:curved DNA-binding protein CbpA
VSEDHYDVLGVDPDASRDDLRAAYRARVDELTAARDKKGVTERQLQENREEVARVRSAWNVLSDPFQRQRYDAQATGGDAEPGSEVEIVDDDAPQGTQLTGWRKLMAPPPPKPAGAGGGRGGARGGGGDRTPPPRREPTIPIPPGIRLAEPKMRGMATLFDVAIVLVILYAVQFLAPTMIQSDYREKVDQIASLNEAQDAQDEIDDANDAIDDADDAIAKAESAGRNQDLRDAQADRSDAVKDRRDAQRDFRDAQKDFNEKQRDQGLQNVTLPHDNDQLDNQASKLEEDIQGTTLAVAAITLVFALAYLVPMTAITGRTLGMRGRKLRVVRVDGSPVGWFGAFARFFIPMIFAVSTPVAGLIGPLIAVAVVAWAFRDPNGQGLHDKAARTLVVEA